jgi:hypothetical protein
VLHRVQQKLAHSGAGQAGKTLCLGPNVDE